MDKFARAFNALLMDQDPDYHYALILDCFPKAGAIFKGQLSLTNSPDDLAPVMRLFEKTFPGWFLWLMCCDEYAKASMGNQWKDVCNKSPGHKLEYSYNHHIDHLTTNPPSLSRSMMLAMLQAQRGLDALKGPL